MAVQRTYKCDLCGDTLQLDESAEAHRAIGIQEIWPRGWSMKPAREAEHHLCPPCISSIQTMPKMCGQGYECNGGPGCGSDHK